ncbi:MAG TPA: heavy metal-binding domain-containing protein [Candidatus Udaeobacter sp.]|nr:heavy metal-binding domain-containing protein [Candidatus Udaeobacter sp.]
MPMKVTRYLGYYAAIVLLFSSADKMGAERPTDEPQPAPSVKAWGILFQVMERFEEYVAGKALSSIHNDDATSSSAISILMSETKRNPSPGDDEANEKLLAFTRAVAALHAAGDAFDQSSSETELAKVRGTFTDMQRCYRSDVLEAARIVAHRFRCPMHPEVIGKKNDLCPKCGMPLDTLARLSPFVLPVGAVPAKMIKASVETDEPLQVGVKAQARLYLRTLLGEPLLPTDLREVHTQKIHLLIVDQSLSDYHHEHPQPGKTSGEYTFSFTPQKPGPYRIWVDVQPYLTGIQEYALAEMAAPTIGERLTDTAESLTATADGLRYRLSFESSSIKSGEPVGGKLQITREDGTPMTELEPVMGAFAHLVAFHSDGKIVLHIHPKGTRQLVPKDRGGPGLEFQFYSAKPGFFRLFSQTQVAGEQKFARFGLIVQP